MTARKQRRPVFAARPDRKQPWDRLPFIGVKRGESRYWNVPFTGSYINGIEVGRDVARLFFNFAQEQTGDERIYVEMLLREMIRGLIEKEAITQEEQYVKNGQYVGFMTQIASHDLSSVYRNRASSATSQQLIDRINVNLSEESAKALEAAINAHSKGEVRS